MRVSDVTLTEAEREELLAGAALFGWSLEAEALAHLQISVEAIVAARVAEALESAVKALEELYDATGDSDALGRRYGIEWVEAAVDGIGLAIDAVTALIAAAALRPGEGSES